MKDIKHCRKEFVGNQNNKKQIYIHIQMKMSGYILIVNTCLR